MSSAAGSTCYTGCRRGHLLKAAQTTKITHRHLRGFKLLPLLKDQMLVVDSYNKNHASCKPSAASTGLVDSSGFKEYFSKPFFNFSAHKILQNFYNFFFSSPQWSKTSCSIKLNSFYQMLCFSIFFSFFFPMIKKLILQSGQLRESSYFEFHCLCRLTTSPAINTLKRRMQRYC